MGSFLPISCLGSFERPRKGRLSTGSKGQTQARLANFEALGQLRKQTNKEKPDLWDAGNVVRAARQAITERYHIIILTFVNGFFEEWRAVSNGSGFRLPGRFRFIYLVRNQYKRLSRSHGILNLIACGRGVL